MKQRLRSLAPWLLSGCLCTQAPAPWTTEQLAADLDQIAAAVRSEWSYLADRRQNSGVDVDALLAEAKKTLPQVHSADDFARSLRRFGAGLQDGHAWTSVPGESPPPARRLPFGLADCREGLVVLTTAAGAGAPLHGDLLVAIDDTPIEDAIRAAAREVFASTPGMRRQLAIAALQRTHTERVRCSLVAADGSRRDLDLATVTAGAVPPVRPATENWSLAWPRAEVAVLQLHSFEVPRWREWLAAKPEQREPFLAEGRARIAAIIADLTARTARTLIVDVRGNGGGTDLLAIHLAERLLDGEFLYFQLAGKHLGTWWPPAGTTYGKDPRARFPGRVIALADEHSFSTTDNFLRCLQDLHPDFTVVGRRTGGGTGAPREIVVAAHSKAVLGACTQRVYGPKGELIEGRGTAPTVPVQWTRADWLQGRDPDLEAALRLATGDRSR